MDKLKFSQNELLEMESLEVRGGACNINSDKKNMKKIQCNVGWLALHLYANIMERSIQPNSFQNFVRVPLPFGILRKRLWLLPHMA
jgi:hypothetical protein